MKEAIEKLVEMSLVRLVKCYSPPAGIDDNPDAFYKNRAYSREGNILKSATVLDREYLYL